jgi:hypothetical protein
VCPGKPVAIWALLRHKAVQLLYEGSCLPCSLACLLDLHNQSPQFTCQVTSDTTGCVVRGTQQSQQC